MALSDVTLETKEIEFQIRQPTAAYYRGAVPLNRDEVVPALTSLLDAWNSRVATHFALLDRLNDLARQLMTKRPWTIGGYYAMCRRSAMRQIASDMKKGYAEVVRVHAETESILKSGGGTA